MRSSSIGPVLLFAACASSSPGTTIPPACPPSQPVDDGSWRAPLERVIGTWVYDGTGDGPQHHRETCRWMPESTFIVCKIENDANTTLLGWEPLKRRFAHHGISATGKVGSVFAGPIEGDRWLYTRPGARVTLTFVDRDRFEIQVERQGADNAWKTFVRGSYRREVAAPE